MSAHQSPRLTSLSVATFGVAMWALMHFLLFTYPGRFLAPSDTAAYLDAWFGPVATVGYSLVFHGTPLIAIALAFSLVYVHGRPVKEVCGWFIAAGIVFAVGLRGVSWVVNPPEFHPSTGVALYGLARSIVILGGSAALAAILGSYLRVPVSDRAGSG